MHFNVFKWINKLLLLLVLLKCETRAHQPEDDTGQCTLESRGKSDCEGSPTEESINRYEESSNVISKRIEKALKAYEPCSSLEDCTIDVIKRDLRPYKDKGISRDMIEQSAKYGTLYKIYNRRLYREEKCMFPARCSGIEHFLLRLLPELPDMDLIVNTRDWPQLPNSHGAAGPVFSFSKTSNYRDIMFPAWTFWAGGPAISLHPTGIGRWDLLRESITAAATKIPWQQKEDTTFFRGSRTSDERDSLVLLSRRSPDLVDAQYTKNQAWKSPKDTLNEEPAKEVSFEDHCRYKFLFNFRGVAASFRLKHLFLCQSLVFHVGDDWHEFFYFALKPWVHYVPVKSSPTAAELEELISFFREHEDLAQAIAQRGFEFISQHLRLSDVETYWRNLLLQYRKLLRYNVKPDKNLIEITK